jgi:hypothetical protein
MNLVIVLVGAAVVAVALSVWLLVAARRRPVPVAASAPYGEDDGIVSEPVPIERGAALEADLPLVSVAPRPVIHEPELDEPEVALDEALSQRASDPMPEPEPEQAVPAAPAPIAAMCWAKRFAPRSGALDDSARLGLIRDLGLVRAPWGVPLLVEAYDEEPDAAHRRAVLAALALYRHLDARAVFERALRSDDEGERAIAGAALADLGVTPSLSS